MKKIPHIDVPPVYTVHDFVDEELVEIPKESGILVDMQYPKLGMNEAIDKCLVRKTVLDKLIEAKESLPGGITFLIWDAYRPLALQKEIYFKYRAELIKTFNLFDLPEERQDDILRQYVSFPSEDENLPPLHATGGAVDITLAKLDGTLLDMGVGFDDFSELSKTDAFEDEGMDESIRDNRRMLYNVMSNAGFTNLPSECWHYEYGNRNWGFYNNKPAIYKGIMKLD